MRQRRNECPEWKSFDKAIAQERSPRNSHPLDYIADDDRRTQQLIVNTHDFSSRRRAKRKIFFRSIVNTPNFRRIAKRLNEKSLSDGHNCKRKLLAAERNCDAIVKIHLKPHK